MTQRLELPKQWERMPLGDICEKVKVVKRREQDPEESFIYLDIGGVNNETNRIESHKTFIWRDAPSRAQQIVRKGDILFLTVRTYLKNIALVDNEKFNDQIASSGFTVIRAGQAGLSKYLFYYSISELFLRPLNELQTGSSYPAVRDKDVFGQPVPVPPIDEQERIVAKIEELFSELDAGVEGLKKAQAQLKTYRQAVLKAAFEGKLTNDNVSDGELPKDWKWRTIAEVSSLLGDGLHGTPNYSEDGEYYFINGNNLQNGKIVFKDNTKRVSKGEFEKYKKALSDKTILVSINGTLGNTAFYNDEKVILGKSACYFNVLDTIDKRFMRYCLTTNRFINYANEEATGSTIKNVGLKAMREFEVPIPHTLDEQQRIVEEIESRLSVCDKLEETIAASLKQSEALRQSILKRAFDGKLVDRDENDEPASVLLRRIRFEREAVEEQQKQNKKKTKRAGMTEKLKTILEILQESRGPIPTRRVWQASTHKDDIDAFYAELKQLFDKKKIKETERDGRESFLTLAAQK